MPGKHGIPEERFLAKIQVDEETGCWLWTGYVKPNGYAWFRDSNKMVYGHIWSYEHWVGPIPDAMDLDHVKERGCRYRHCVNHAHLEPVTRQVNLLRGDTIPARLAARTHCNYGHLLEGVNVIRNTDGTRRCRECKNAAQRDWWHNRRR